MKKQCSPLVVLLLLVVWLLGGCGMITSSTEQTPLSTEQAPSSTEQTSSSIDQSSLSTEQSTSSTEQSPSSPSSPSSSPKTPVHRSTLSPKHPKVSTPSISSLQPLPKSPTSPTSVEEKPFTHKIRWQGETISRISLWYTGSGQNWPAIMKANPTIDPHGIAIGDLIVIPKNLLRTREPMTVDFRSYEEIKKILLDKPFEPQKVDLQEVELFGPVDSVGPSSLSENTEADLPLEGLD